MPLAETRRPDAAGGYAFAVPPELEAHEPAEVRSASRDDVRLLVTDPVHGARHSHFSRLADYLAAGDLLVLNDSKTYPAAVVATRESGEPVLLHFARLDSNDGSDDSDQTLALAEPRKAAVAAGDRVTLPGGGSATIARLYPGSRRKWITRLALPLPYYAYFSRYGKPIAYPHVSREFSIDAYQTEYASALGSSEMPSAGRPFTQQMFEQLKSRGIDFAMVTLHAGTSSDERDELPSAEWREVPLETVTAIRHASKRGSRIIAVGTTVVRALESSLDRQHRIVPSRGWTGLHIAPDRPMRLVAGLITGFHEPTSTHLAILESIVGRPHVENAYAAALSERYLWHEFGDSHLILPQRR